MKKTTPKVGLGGAWSRPTADVRTALENALALNHDWRRRPPTAAELAQQAEYLRQAQARLPRG